MSQIDLNGIFPPIPTPFAGDDIAYDKLALNIDKWSQTGLKGLVVMGSNGEYVYLSAKEKRELVKRAVELTPDRMPVIAGTGCVSTRETIELTRDSTTLPTTLRPGWLNWPPGFRRGARPPVARLQRR